MTECYFGCGREVGDRGDYQQVLAWVRIGRRDSVSLREDVQPPRLACRSCLVLRQRGVPVEQGSLT